MMSGAVFFGGGPLCCQVMWCFAVAENSGRLHPVFNSSVCKSLKGTNVSDSHRCRSSCFGKCLVNMLGLVCFSGFWCGTFSRRRNDNMLQETSFGPLTPCTSITVTKSDEKVTCNKRFGYLGFKVRRDAARTLEGSCCPKTHTLSEELIE
jgi:hypothetical protein